MRSNRLILLSAAIGLMALSTAAGAQETRNQEFTVRNENLGTCKVQVQVKQAEQVLTTLLVQPDAERTINVALNPTGLDITFKIFGIGCSFYSYTHAEHVDPRLPKVTLVVAQNPNNTWVALTTLRQ